MCQESKKGSNADLTTSKSVAKDQPAPRWQGSAGGVGAWSGADRSQEKGTE